MKQSILVLLCCLCLSETVLAQNQRPKQPDPDKILTIIGTVQTKRGQAVAGATVALIPHMERSSVSVPPEPIMVTESDKDGSYLIRAKQRDIAVCVVRANFGDTVARSRSYRGQEDGRLKLDLMLSESRPVTVIVKDAQGKPVPNALVRLLGGGTFGNYAGTDQNGVAVLSIQSSAATGRFPAREPLFERVLAVADGVGSGEYLAWSRKLAQARQANDDAALAALQSSGPQNLPDSLEITLKPTRSLTVRLLSNSKQKVADKEVTVTFPAILSRRTVGARRVKASTNADGEVVFPNVLSGTGEYAEVSFRGAHGLYRAFKHKVSEGTTVSLSEDDLVVISGQVSRLGKPLAGVEIQAVSGGLEQAQMFAESTRTDENGRYSIRVLPMIAASVSIDDKKYSAQPYHTTVDPRNVETVNFDADTIQTFSGRALRNGKALADTTLRISPGRLEVVTDAEGRFETMLAPGQYTVSDAPDGGTARVSIGKNGLTGYDVEIPVKTRSRWGG